ncbi:MAG: biotin transporter BioY [Lachnospiraceae bacterium]|nr:biotin transporter BioY [Lachnospiraceae bacterium]
MKIKTITSCALFAALMCICGPLSVPIGPVPVSLTNLVIYFSLVILGTKSTLISYVVYLLLGLVGLPVFSGFQGGIGKIAGPTGGYLLGFIFIILISGLIMEMAKRNPGITILGMILGTAICYVFGTAWFVFLMKCEIPYALTLCVWPFVPFDMIKILVAVFVGRTIRKSLTAANVLK